MPLIPWLDETASMREHRDTPWENFTDEAVDALVSALLAWGTPLDAVQQALLDSLEEECDARAASE